MRSVEVIKIFPLSQFLIQIPVIHVIEQLVKRQCQIKKTEPTNAAVYSVSGSKLTPLGEGGGAIELEVFAAIKVALLVEVVVN